MSSKGYSIRDIAKVLGRSISTLSEEISLNNTRGNYDPNKAHHKAYTRRKYSKYQGMKIVGNKRLKSFVDKNLYDEQSPPAISGRIKHRERNLEYVSKNSIYHYIRSVYGRKIESFLRRRKCRRRGPSRKRNFLTDRIFIDKRPKCIEKRQRLGDVEADFLESGKSGKGVILVVADRKTRNSFLEQIIKVKIGRVHQAFLKIQKRFPELKTITTDNDILLQKHKELEKILGVKIYFCHQYHSWGKGTVENINKCIRKYIPKGSDISSYSRSFIYNLEERLNQRILACLNFRTPLEKLEEVRKKNKRQRRRRFA